MRKVSYHDLGLLSLLVFATLAYIPINHASRGGTDLATALDSQIPLIPLFAIPYLVFLPLLWGTVVYALIKQKDFTRLAAALTIVYLTSNLIYLVFITYFVRPEQVTGWLGGIVSYIYDHDRPYCDFPSEHVSSATIFALYWWANAKKYRGLLVAFATSVILATILIKQHTILGAIGGVIIGILTWLGVSKLVYRDSTKKI